VPLTPPEVSIQHRRGRRAAVCRIRRLVLHHIGVWAEDRHGLSHGARILSGDETSAPGAAFVNGVASAVLEFDDTHIATNIHPTGVVLSARLPLAQSGHRAWTAGVGDVGLGVEGAGDLGQAQAGGRPDMRLGDLIRAFDRRCIWRLARGVPRRVADLAPQLDRISAPHAARQVRNALGGRSRCQPQSVFQSDPRCLLKLVKELYADGPNAQVDADERLKLINDAYQK
jgi:hypothetical protein